MANPKKPAEIEAILRRNKDKLLAFLQNFHNDKEGKSLYFYALDPPLIRDTDEQFTDEKQFLIVQIQGL